MSKALDIAIRSAEQQAEKELSAKFSARMQANLKDTGTVGSVRHAIITSVATENYQRAIDEVRKWLTAKEDFPQFAQRSERYLNYAIDLINATKAKRSFPGLSYLGMSKQQELFDRAMEHFEDLKRTLKRVEQIERDVQLEDIRSTVWVVKAIIFSVFAMLVLGFLMEVAHGVLPAANVVIDDTFGIFTNKIFDALGF